MGNATLYRRFADREDLIRQVAIHVITRIAEAAENAAAETPDAFEALRVFLHRAADQRAGAVIPAMFGRFTKTETFHEVRDRARSAIEQIVHRAQQAGQLRTDVDANDLWALLIQLTRPMPGTSCAGLENYTHRHIELLFDGLRAHPLFRLPGDAFTMADLKRAPAIARRQKH